MEYFSYFGDFTRYKEAFVVFQLIVVFVGIDSRMWFVVGKGFLDLFHSSIGLELEAVVEIVADVGVIAFGRFGVGDTLGGSNGGESFAIDTVRSTGIGFD